LTHHATGGNPGGYISVDDLELGMTWFFLAPAKFLGNQSAAFGGSLQFDLSMAGDPNAPRINQPDARLIDTDSGLNLVFDASPDPSFFPNWSSFTIPLVIASAGWKVGNLAGPAATDAQLLTALSSLDVLRIRGEFFSGGNPPDTGSLDNVKLVQSSTVPEPASLLLIGAGLIALTWVRRCQGHQSLLR
jgi:alkaline phosphatase D